ncbi:MAG: STAS domain-containing protein [Bacilli bacterium]|nr:STAS domain-containing protein [Bacilli bacterium]
MLKANMEFRKGILFIRLKGDLNKSTIKGIIDDNFKYIVLNIDNMYSIDSYSIKYLNKLYKNFEEDKGKMIICDKFNISRRLLNNIPKIDNEYDAFKLFERMI